MKLSKYKSMFLFLLLVIMMVGCTSGPAPEEKIYEVLEQVVSVEKDFKDQQNPLLELEKQEKAIYDQIISLSMDDYEQIVSLADQAIEIVNKRETHLTNEHNSIQSSKVEFDKVNPIIDEIEEGNLKDEAQGLVSLMNDRYESYEKLYLSYNEAITYDKALYEMFKKEDLTLEELEDQINKINKTYETVVTNNDTFNKFTDQYNQAKVTFYKNAGLNVVYEENEDN